MIVIIVCVIARFRLTGLILFSLFFIQSVAHSLSQFGVCLYNTIAMCARLLFLSHFLAHVTTIHFTLMSICRMMSFVSLCVRV